MATFPIFNQPSTAADRLPSNARGTLVPEEAVGANVALGRLAAQSSGGAIYLIPAANEVCVKSTSGAQNFCASVAEAEAGEAQELIVCAPAIPSSDIQVAGLLPESASNVQIVLRNGSSVPVTVSNGTYAALFSRTSSLPASVTWSAGGASHSAPINVPTRASSESCEG